MKNKNANIHIRVDEDTQDKWLRICNIYHGNTQSKVFRKLINLLHETIDQSLNVRNYE